MARLQLVTLAGPTRQELIDEFGELERRIMETAPLAKRYRLLQETIRDWYKDEPADQAAVAEGGVYRVMVAPRGVERFFSLKAKTKIFGKLGKLKALELFSITLKAVETEFGTPALDALVSSAPTGSRKLVAVMKASAVKAA
jgi:hypothetical protein